MNDNEETEWNKEFAEGDRIKKLSRVPLLSYKRFFGKKGEIGKQETLEEVIETIRNSNSKDESIEKIRKIESRIEKDKFKIEKPDEPLLFLIKDNFDVEIFEGIKSGRLKIRKSNGEKAMLILPKRKLVSLPWKGESLRVWIADEKSATAYPEEPLYDSKDLVETYETLLANRKDLETQRIRAWSDLFIQIAIGVVIIIVGLTVVPPMFGVDLLGMLFAPKAAEAAAGAVTQTAQTISDANGIAKVIVK